MRLWLSIALFKSFTFIIFLLSRRIDVLNVELAMLFWHIALEEIAHTQFLFMIFAVAQLWLHLKMFLDIVKV